MLNMNLSRQNVSAIANMYDVPIEVFFHLWRPLHDIVSYSKVCVPYEGEDIVSWVSPNKSMYLLKKVCPFRRPFQHIIQLYSQTIFAPFVIVPSRQMRGMGEGSRLFSDQLLDVPLICVLLYFVVTAALCNTCPTLH